MPLVKEKKTLDDIDERQARIEEELNTARFLLGQKVDTIERSREIVDASFQSLQRSLDELVYVLKMYQEKSENISRMKRRVLGAEKNKQQMQVLRQSWNS